MKQTLEPSDSERMIAWNKYMKSEAFANAIKWAKHREPTGEHKHVEGSLWDAFCAGWNSICPTKTDS